MKRRFRLTEACKGGFYHDGRFPTLVRVVNDYNEFKKLNMSEQEKDLVEFLNRFRRFGDELWTA